MAHPWTPEVKKCPYPYYDKWRSESPVLWNAEMGAWLVTGYKEGAYVLEHDEIFSSMNSVFQPQADLGAQEFFPSMINIDEPRHKHLRALAAKAFTPRSLERDWVPLIKRVVDEQLAGIDPHTFNVVRDLAFPLPVRVIATVIGVEAEKYEWFKWCSDEAAKGIGLPLEEGSEAAMNFFNAITQLQTYFLDQAEIRRAQPREDLFTRLVHAEIDGEKLTDAELQAFLVLLLVAGNETTTNNIGCTVRLLADDPALLERVRADRSLVWNLIEESLRVESPIQGFYRKALVDAEVSGVRIKAGDPLLVLYGAANHDPAFVACPAQFNLDGARRDHLAFGKGVHYCLGANLARIESELAINGVLDRFETMAPLVKDAGAVEWRPTPFFRGMVEYPIAYTAYARPLNTAFESAYRFN
jgi:cytochrome P450